MWFGDQEPVFRLVDLGPVAKADGETIPERRVLLETLVRICDTIHDGGGPFAWRPDDYSDESYVLSQVEPMGAERPETLFELVINPPGAEELAAVCGNPGDFEEGLEWYLAGCLAYNPAPYLAFIEDHVEDSNLSEAIFGALGLVATFPGEAPDEALPALERARNGLRDEDFLPKGPFEASRLRSLLAALEGSRSPRALEILKAMRSMVANPSPEFLRSVESAMGVVSARIGQAPEA